MAKLPTVTSNVAPDLRAFLDRVREAINGTGADSLVSVRQLVAAGLVTHTGTGITGTGGTGLVSPPIRPENVEAAGALANIMVTWDKPIYNGHAYAEIWSAARSTEQAAATPPENPILGQAELVGMAPGVFFAHNLGAGATRFYWVRFVNLLGEVGPYQSTEGILGQTSVDPAYMLEVLTGAITEGQLYNDLSSRIDLIDSDTTVVGSVAARIAAEALARTNSLAAEALARTNAIAAEALARTNALAAEAAARGTAVTSEQTARQSADAALAQSITTLTSSVGGNTSAIQGEQTARTTADSALASDITVLDTRLTTAEGGVTGNASAFTGLDTRVTTAEGELTTNASDITSLDTRLTTAEGGVTGNASAFTGLDTRVTTAEGELTTNASDITSLDTRLTTAEGGVTGNASAFTGLDTRVTTAEGGITTNASDITSLDTRLTTAEGGVTGNASAVTGLDTRVTTAEGGITTNASDITSLDTRLTTAEGGVTGNASAFTGLDTRVTTAEGEITTNASDITSLTTSVGTNAAAISAEATARANADSAEATARTTLQATLGADLTSAVQTEATARAAADGVIEAKYTVKVDVGGHVAGYGLIANANDGAIVSEFGIRADQFFLAPPTIAQNSAPASAARYVGMSWVDTDNNNQQRYWSGTAWVVDSPSLPFLVRTSPTTINGEAVPAGVYIRDGFIQNGTIVNAQIGDAAIDNAKIANINADKINAGFIDAARIEAGSIDANKIDSRGLSIKDSSGNIILAAGTPLSVDNYVAPPETSSLFYNSNFTRVAVDGRPAGVYSCNSSNVKANISFQDAAKTILKIATATTDTTIGGALQAIRVDPNVTYMIYARVKATTASSTGFYMRARELDTELANGVNFIGGSSIEATGVASTRTKNFLNFGAGTGTFSNVAITTGWVDLVAEYKPTSTAKWMSVEFLNWTGMGTAELHVARCIIATKQTKITDSNASTFIDDAAIDFAHIKVATINDLSSLAVDAGTITAGILKSSDNKFVIDLNNKTISIET